MELHNLYKYSKELDEKSLINLIDKTVYNSYESGSYGNN